MSALLAAGTTLTPPQRATHGSRRDALIRTQPPFPLPKTPNFDSVRFRLDDGPCANLDGYALLVMTTTMSTKTQSKVPCRSRYWSSKICPTSSMSLP